MKIWSSDDLTYCPVCKGSLKTTLDNKTDNYHIICSDKFCSFIAGYHIINLIDGRLDWISYPFDDYQFVLRQDFKMTIINHQKLGNSVLVINHLIKIDNLYDIECLRKKLRLLLTFS